MPVSQSEVDLLERHAYVLFDMDADGRLVAVNEPDGEPPPRVFLARGRESTRIWFRHDVPTSTVSACRVVAADLPGWDSEQPAVQLFDRLRDALSADAQLTAEEGGPAFRFGERADFRVEGVAPQVIGKRSRHLLARYFPYTRDFFDLRQPVVGAVLDGSVVAACYSARKRELAAEAGVATEERYRGRGLGPLVVSAWRDAVESEGMQPLYSRRWDNVASRAVARKLRLIAYADTLSLA